MGDSVSIVLLEASNSQLLERVAEGTFDDPIDPKFRDAFIADPRHHMMLALRGGVVVGMASGVVYVHPDKPDELWINEVGVAPEFQRQGIARELMRALFEHGRSVGCREAWLGTEVENAAARALYASMDGEEQPMVYVTFELGEE